MDFKVLVIISHGILLKKKTNKQTRTVHVIDVELHV